MSAFLSLIRRDLSLAWKHGNALLMALGFFIIAISLFPLSLGPDRETLGRVAGGVIWVSALFSVMLTLERVFGPDHEDGSLEQLTLLPMPLAMVALAKTIAHWIIASLPLVLAAPLVAIALNLPLNQVGILAITLLLGTPALSAIGCLGAALTLGVRQSGVILSLLILPLFVPILIFGAGAVEASTNGTGAQGALQILGAISLIAIVLGPPVTASALRLAME